jgi:superfamily II DNA or RNA helicase
MPSRVSPTGSELFIVDNSDTDWKVVRYLHDWCQISKAIDIATGFFEIGSLLALNGEWQKVDQIRILMGDEVSRRTQKAFLEGLQNIERRLDTSIETEKLRNDFLSGVPAIVEAIRSGKIACRVYRKEKFHAKAYITHARLEVVGASALVGSSNFTYPGLNENVELNVQITGRPVSVLQEWYEEHWDRAEDVTVEILKTIERHIIEYVPFLIYAKALQEFFRGHEMTATEWELAGPEQEGSHVYPILDQYQKEGYHALMKIAGQHGGAFLCDGVGLGKTYVGLMLIERLVRDKKNVALFVPKAARKDVWERDIERYLPHLGSSIYSRLSIFNHTDLVRGGSWQKNFDRVKEAADVIVIDEAHHFRNPGVRERAGQFKNRYWRLYDIVEKKTLFFLTATPINNRLTDLQHMIELFSRRKPDYFGSAPLGIHSLSGHFRKLEKALEKIVESAQDEAPDDGPDIETNEAEAEMVLWNDDLFRALVVQRSRAYVKQSQTQHGGSKAIFPKREPPKVASYQLRKTYGRLLDMVEKAFEKQKPLFSLAVYYPLAYYIGPDMEKQQKAFMENRQKELLGLIRTQFLKRFESSARAFEFSCETLMLKLLAWLTKHSQTDHELRRLERWKAQHAQLIGYVHRDQHELTGEEYDDEQDDDVIDPGMLEDIEELSRDEYKVHEIIDETYLDLDEIAEFLQELKKFKPANDDKLKALIKLLQKDHMLKDQKVLIFSEFMATARYLKKQLDAAGLADVDEVDSATKRNRSDIIRKFAPYYNRPPEGHPLDGIDHETRILISTDVLSEGLNLQDAARMINYDLHWNPVRLMQRIGRVDRRLNLEIEAQIIADRPDQEQTRGTIAYWNFLPPDELDSLLKLYAKVSKKTLRISKVFGIEGKKLLRPDDDFDALKDFVHQYEGTTSNLEAMHLQYQRLLAQYPDLEARLTALPGRVFSGKEHPSKGSRAVFFCYALPAPSARDRGDGSTETQAWTEDAGSTKWYLYDLSTEKILEEPGDIVHLIRSTPDTPRYRSVADQTLSEIRARIDKHIKNTYLKQVQAPAGVRPILKAWMELS